MGCRPRFSAHTARRGTARLRQGGQRLRGIAQLAEGGHALRGKLLLHKVTHVLRKVDAHNGKLVKIPLHIVLEHGILDLKAAHRIFFGVVQTDEQKQSCAKGEQQQQRQQQAGSQKPVTGRARRHLRAVPGKQSHLCSSFPAGAQVRCPRTAVAMSPRPAHPVLPRPQAAGGYCFWRWRSWS